jgi:F0F1-type ATP synthase epsilon subunit
MQLSVFSQIKVLYEGHASEVILPGEDGELTALDFHQAFLSRLRSGYIRIKTQNILGGIVKDASTSRIKIKYGVAKMFKNELVILAEPYA